MFAKIAIFQLNEDTFKFSGKKPPFGRIKIVGPVAYVFHQSKGITLISQCHIAFRSVFGKSDAVAAKVSQGVA